MTFLPDMKGKFGWTFIENGRIWWWRLWKSPYRWRLVSDTTFRQLSGTRWPSIYKWFCGRKSYIGNSFLRITCKNLFKQFFWMMELLQHCADRQVKGLKHSSETSWKRLKNKHYMVVWSGYWYVCLSGSRIINGNKSVITDENILEQNLCICWAFNILQGNNEQREIL